MKTVIAYKKQIAIDAAVLGARAIRKAIETTGASTIVVATGASQFDVLARLVQESGIDWSKVTAFHLDEYLGLPVTHKASFRKYLQERFVTPLGGVVNFIPVVGDATDIAAEIARLNGLIAGRRIDVCFAGIGENGHLAFNDPPADFETDAPYIVVALDEACRRQQLGEGWFTDLDAVPRQAISMSIRQILKSELIILNVPDARKAAAVQATVEGPVTPTVPASIIQRHGQVVLYLDHFSAERLKAAKEGSL